MTRKGACFVLAFALGGCASALPRTTSLRVEGAPPDASVAVDDRYVGTFAYVASKGVALPPGRHRLTVEKVGFFPWDRLVEAHDGDLPIQIKVALLPVPD